MNYISIILLSIVLIASLPAQENQPVLDRLQKLERENAELKKQILDLQKQIMEQNQALLKKLDEISQNQEIMLNILAALAIEARKKFKCPIVTGQLDDHFYLVISKEMTWQDAKKLCEYLGGHLVTICSEQENRYVSGLLYSLSLTQGWIGYSDEETEGNWKWVTGEPSQYTKWNSGEPNDMGNEDYTIFRADESWNDVNSTCLAAPICEFEPSK